MNETELLKRSKSFALRIVRLCRALPENREGRIFGSQILRSGTSVAANYRAVCRARSKDDFAAKMGLVVEEADETAFWLEMLRDSGIVPVARLEPLLAEANELLAIFCASQKTVRAHNKKSKI